MSKPDEVNKLRECLKPVLKSMDGVPDDLKMRYALAALVQEVNLDSVSLNRAHFTAKSDIAKWIQRQRDARYVETDPYNEK